MWSQFKSLGGDSSQAFQRRTGFGGWTISPVLQDTCNGRYRKKHGRHSVARRGVWLRNVSTCASEASLISRAGDWAADQSGGGRHWLSVWAAPSPPCVCESFLELLDNSQAGAVMQAWWLSGRTFPHTYYKVLSL